jgi:hypothetical protein
MGKNEGFIQAHRKLRGHWLWDNPDYVKWWMDILMECNHGDKKVIIGWEICLCKRGQTLRSIRNWGKQWRVDKSRVYRFFNLLKNDGMITTENIKKTTLLTVNNYQDYNKTRRDTKPADTQDSYAKPARQFRDNSETLKRDTKPAENHLIVTFPRDNCEHKQEVLYTNTLTNSIDTNTHLCENEFSQTNEQENKYNEWMRDNAPRVQQMSKPLTYQQFQEIKKIAPGPEILRVLEEMHNFKPLLSRYISANLTLRKWLKQPKNGIKQTPPANGGAVIKIGTSAARIDKAKNW